MRHACFSTRADLTTCAEHLPSRTDRHHAHAIHQRAFDHMIAARMLPRFFGVLDDVGVMPRQGVGQAFRAPALGQDRSSTCSWFGPEAFANSTGARWRLARFSRTSSTRSFSSPESPSYNAELAGVDDAHVHAGLDGVIRKAVWIASRTGSLPRRRKTRLTRRR